MEAKAKGETLREDNSPFPSQPLHRVGGLHYAEPGGHGATEKDGGHKEATLEKAPADKNGDGANKHASGEHDKAQPGPRRPGGEAGQAPLMEEDSLKVRLKEAEKNAKKSADDKYRALKDIEAEVEKGHGARKDDDGTDHDAKQKAADPMASIIDANEEDSAVHNKKKDNAKAAAQQEASPTTKPLSTKSTAEKQEEVEQTRLRSMLAEILSRSPVTIFSKTYCPHSAKAKHILLEAYSILPAPHVVELDIHPDGPALQGLLMKTTGRRTVPNVLVNGKSIGGGDETALLWKSGELPARIKQMAGKRVASININFGFGKEPKEGRA